MTTKPYGLRLAKTSNLCPEQYDVFDKKVNDGGIFD